MLLYILKYFYSASCFYIFNIKRVAWQIVRCGACPFGFSNAANIYIILLMKEIISPLLDLSESFAQVEKIAGMSKARRMLYSPAKYFYAILYRKILSRFLGLSRITKVDTFFNRPMRIRFPAGTDIYLTRGKTDDAELRLTRFLFSELSAGDRFIDIGAHFGYYPLLASICTGNGGKVIAIEPSQETYALLQMNTNEYSNITAIHMAVAGSEGMKEFYEFPHIYSEYSSVYPQQFQKQKWFRRIEAQKTEVHCVTLDSLLSPLTDRRTVIKIDAEGSEYDILKGGVGFLRQSNSATIIMEYLNASRGNTNHKEAAKILSGNGYNCFRITQSGTLLSCEDVNVYLTTHGMESDNFVFKK
jgi:FkbM family methyltransferase